MPGRNLALRRSGLRFEDAAVERDYVAYHHARAASFVRLGAAGIGFAWMNASCTVAVVRPDLVRSWLLVLAITQVPLLGAMATAAADRARHWMLLPTSAAALLIGTFLAVGVSTVVYEDQGTAIGALVVCAYFVPLLRMPTAVGLAVCLFVGAGYAAFLGFGQPLHHLDLVHKLLYLSLWFTSNGIALGLAYVMEQDERRAFVGEQVLEWQRGLIETEKARAERLLLNILPGPIAERLKRGDLVIADAVADVTVLFLDIVGFTQFAHARTPTEVVAVLNEIFTAFDGLAERHGVEKIKTIGDAYMAVAGLPNARADHADAAANLALDMRDWMAAAHHRGGAPLQVRLGLYSGPVVAGVIGASKFAYDLWGDAVNSAARMESHGVVGQVQVGDTTRALLGDRYTFEDRGEIDVKGRGPMRAWILQQRRHGEG